MSDNQQHMPYEGAGFILRYHNDIILGLRRKKPADAAKDPTPELEYMGGKPEVEDGSDPLHTAYAELVEELGAPVLDDGWRTRVRVIHVWQPFSKKWIWCCVLQLTDREMALISSAAASLDDDSKWEQPMTQWTGRAAPVKRALDAIFLCPVAEVARYMTGFAQVPASKNRMTDAKEYRARDALKARHLLTGAESAYALRAFNAVMWEQHIERIIQ